MVINTLMIVEIITSTIYFLFTFYPFTACFISIPVPSKVAMSDEEPKDQKKELDKKNHDKCKTAWDAYEACGKRIKGKQEVNCAGYYFDYHQCIDHHTSKELFSKLK